MRTRPSTTAFLRLRWRLRSSNCADAGWKSKRALQAISRLAVRQPDADHDFCKITQAAIMLLIREVAAFSHHILVDVCDHWCSCRYCETADHSPRNRCLT